ncbi:MAG TPA: hypothetical protein VGI83_10295 [Gemmatimonadales bacterium]|jgi:hypothetical protein
MLNRSKAWAGMVLGATFISGAVVGSAGAAAWADYRKPAAAHQTFADVLQANLSLSRLQRDSVDMVLKGYQAPLNDAYDNAVRVIQPARETYHTSRDSIFGQVRRRISSFLTPEQRLTYQGLNARSDSIRRARENRVSQTNRGHDSAASKNAR